MTEREEQLTKNNDVLQAQIEKLTNQVQLLTEQVDYFTRKLFLPSREKSKVPENQLSLFHLEEDFF